MAKKIVDSSSTEYLTLFFSSNTDRYNVKLVEANRARAKPQYRLTVDYPEDYELMKIIFEAGKEFEYMPLESIIEYLDNNPQFAILNQWLSQQIPENIDTRLRLEH